jgi:imidazolonepropionase-like amidohydrolase
MPTGLRAARLLISSEHDIIEDGLVIVDTESGKITYAGAREDRPVGDTDITIEDLGDVTLMPGAVMSQAQS